MSQKQTEYTDRLAQVQAANQRQRAAMGRYTAAHLISMERRASSSTAEGRPGCEADIVAAKAVNDLIDKARAPILAAGWARNAYGKPCMICAKAVELGYGWATKGKVTGKWFVRCEAHIWEAESVQKAAALLGGHE